MRGAFDGRGVSHMLLGAIIAFPRPVYVRPAGSIPFPEPAIPWEGNGGSGIIRDRHTKNCMSPVLRMRFNKPQ